MLQAAVLAGGVAVFQLGIGGCIRLGQIINPCETVLAQCTQQQIDFLVHSIPDFIYDPTCTIPGACGELPFANFSGGINGTGPGIRPGGPRGGSPP
jgi:hypothetical protein